MKAESQQEWMDLFLKFIEFLRIDSKEMSANDSRGSKLELWTSQKIFLQELAVGLSQGIRIFICLKSRQLGISTISLALDIFWLAMHPGTIGCLVTDNEKNSNTFRSTIRRYIQNFPPGFFGKDFAIVKGGDNRTFMKFSNGSRLDFLIAGTRKKSTWSEGAGYAFAHLTEVSKYGDPAGLESFRETMSQTNPNRLYIYESTANGWNHYRDMWVEAGRDTHTKHRFFAGWWASNINMIPKSDPRYAIYGAEEPDDEERELINAVKEEYGHVITKSQLAWYRYRQSEESADPASLHQNQPWTAEEAFVLSGFSFFQTRLLQQDLGRIYEEDEHGNRPIHFKGFKYWFGNDFHSGRMERIVDQERINEVELRVWEEPVKDATYVIGCDPAFGRNDWKDRHAVSVWRCYADKLVQVAEYATDNVETYQAAWVLAFLAGTYRNCIVNVELTGGPGRAVLREFDNLRERMRSDTYADTVKHYEWDDFLYNARWYLYNRPDTYSSGGNLKAFESTGSSKFYLCNSARDSYSTRLLDIRSAPLIEEMMSVVQDGFAVGAPGKSKDDRVFAMMLANMAWVDHLRNRLINDGYTYEMVQLKESGEISAGAAIVDRLVVNFFKTAEEMAEQGVDTRPVWLVERGLA